MKIKGITIFLPIGFVILLLLVLLALPVSQDSAPQIQFVDRNRNFSLSLYYDEDNDKQYLFLPSFLSVSDLTLSCPWYIHAELTNDSQTPIDISAAPLDTELFLKIKALGRKEQCCSLQILQGSAHKTISIQAQGGIMEYITADKSREGNVGVTILDKTGNPEFQGTSTISGRGNGTWTWVKKPFNLEFSQKISFGPFQNVQKLCLFAEYTDESKMRNAIAFQAGALQEIPFTSPYCYADVYVNGQYCGLYGLATKDTYQHDPNVRAVFEIPSHDNTFHFKTGMGKYIKVHYGSQSEIEGILSDIEFAIFHTNWAELSKIMDVTSFSKKYVLDEFLCNIDTSYGSQYFYIDTDGIVHCMLPWDYEWSLFSRYTHFQGLPERQIAADFFSYCWWQDLLVFPEFRDALCEELSQNYTEPFLAELDQYTETCIAELEKSRFCDLIRWPDFVSNENLLSGFTDLSQFRTLFRQYYPSRISFLQDYWANPESHVKITLSASSPNHSSFPSYESSYYFPSGTILSQQEKQILRATPSRADLEFLGWYSESGIPLQEIGPVTEDLTLIGEYDYHLEKDSISANEPVPIPDDNANTASPQEEIPLPTEAAVLPAEENQSAIDTDLPSAEEVTPPIDEAAQDTAQIPISSISIAFSGLFLVFLCAVVLGECRRLYRQKEVYSSERKSKSLSK